jgi:hypothetical protein
MLERDDSIDPDRVGAQADRPGYNSKISYDPANQLTLVV